MNNEDINHVASGQRQLFLDDHGIESLEGLSRTVHQPDKKGAVIRPEAGLSGREQHSIQTHSAPIWDADRNVWQLWCSSPTTISASGYFESDDGLHWYKPVMNQVEYRGSRANHFVDYALRDHREGPATVVYDPVDPDPAPPLQVGNLWFPDPRRRLCRLAGRDALDRAGRGAGRTKPGYAHPVL